MTLRWVDQKAFLVFEDLAGQSVLGDVHHVQRSPRVEHGSQAMPDEHHRLDQRPKDPQKHGTCAG